jgi:hypothetical protein
LAKLLLRGWPECRCICNRLVKLYVLESLKTDRRPSFRAVCVEIRTAILTAATVRRNFTTAMVVMHFRFLWDQQLPAPKAGGLYKCQEQRRFCRGPTGP